MVLLALLDLAACSGGSAATPCQNPVPVMVANVDTGFDECGNGFVRRRKAVECPDLLPNSVTCGSPTDTCSTDADCGKPYGYCGRDAMGDCSCQQGCRTDADCGHGEICVCGYPIGHCDVGSCRTDADCGSGYLCSSYTLYPACGAQAFACQRPGDSCAGDADCAKGSYCTFEKSHRVCEPMYCGA